MGAGEAVEMIWGLFNCLCSVEISESCFSRSSSERTLVNLVIATVGSGVAIGDESGTLATCGLSLARSSLNPY